MSRAFDKFIVGAYVASISLREWDERDETLFYHHLKKRPDIGGLEHPFYGTLHRYDDDWFLKNVRPDWDFVFTCLPGTVERIKNNPQFGLASQNEKGREAALAFILEAHRAVKKLNHYLKRKSVTAVAVHSAPAKEGSKEAFAKSLREIDSWDWDGAKILMEHCDAYRGDGQYAKGFLPLEDEMGAMKQTKIGAMLNWGRSVVEGRNTTHILEQIDQLKRENLLKGFIFSGTTKDFADKHTPPPTPNNGQIDYAESLMTKEAIGKSLERLPADLDFLGFKIMPNPIPKNCEASLVVIDHMLDILKFQTSTATH